MKGILFACISSIDVENIALQVRITGNKRTDQSLLEGEKAVRGYWKEGSERLSGRYGAGGGSSVNSNEFVV